MKWQIRAKIPIVAVSPLFKGFVVADEGSVQVEAYFKQGYKLCSLIFWFQIRGRETLCCTLGRARSCFANPLYLATKKWNKTTMSRFVYWKAPSISGNLLILLFGSILSMLGCLHFIFIFGNEIVCDLFWIDLDMFKLFHM